MSRLAAFLLVIGIVGLPVNTLSGYVLLLIAAVVIWTGTIMASMRRMLAALGLTAVLIAAHLAFPPPRIEEGHNVFSFDPSRRPNALEQGLPKPAFDHMLAAFDRAYPSAQRCNAHQDGCWLNGPPQQQTYAFSADGLYDAPLYSRRVSGIHIGDPTWWRIGAINEIRFNWYPRVSDVQRGDITFGLRMGWQPTFPWFAVFQFPQAFAGSALCWRGDLLWEQADGRFEVRANKDRGCRTIEANDAGRRIFAISIGSTNPLAIELTPNWTVWLLQSLSALAKLLGVAAVLFLLVRVEPRKLIAPVATLAATAAVVLWTDVTFGGGFHFYDGSDDGLVHEGFGRLILQALLQGDFATAIRGQESIYFFTPGLRYVRALERLVFGDTNFAYLSLLLASPFLVFALFRRFVGRFAAAVVTALFITSLGAPFGLNLNAFAIVATMGYPDTAGAFALIAGLLVVMAHSARDDAAWPAAFGGALLLALSVFLRPNLMPLAGIVAGGGVLIALGNRRYPQALALCAGFSAVGVMALHNWVFGGRFVPFGSNAAIPQVLAVPPSLYIAGLWDILQLDFGSQTLDHIRRHLTRWVASPTTKQPFALLSLPILIALLRVLMTWRRYPVWLRVIALAALSGHAVALFYHATQRYHLLTWMLTSLVALAWLKTEGLPALQRAFPQPTKRWRQSKLRTHLYEGRARLNRMRLLA